MCRWLAYCGEPIFLDTLITQPDHSLVQQSLNTRLNYDSAGQLLTTNGDGFGIGWYDQRPDPGIFKEDLPAWHNINLQKLCHHIQSSIFMAHVRATTTGDIQRTNCHPFCHGNWLFQHNGHVSDFPALRRELQFAVDPALFPEIRGTTDSETMFMLAITYGLKENPKKALQEMVRKVESVLFKHDSRGVLNLSCALSDGEQLYTLRYSRNEAPMTQFYSTDVSCEGLFHPHEDQQPEFFTVVVSEPLDSTGRKWVEIPNNTFTTIRNNEVVTEKFMDD